MNDEFYEKIREILHLHDTRTKLLNEYRDYVWENDILEIISMRLMDMEDSFIADIKKR